MLVVKVHKLVKAYSKIKLKIRNKKKKIMMHLIKKQCLVKSSIANGCGLIHGFCSVKRYRRISNIGGT